MNCPHCNTVNSETAKFCSNCGAALARLPSAYAAKLEAARARRAMEGERRIVTILFCDVKGSTAMAETLDPEEWAEIMNMTFQHLIPPVYRYEGTVARLMGDALLAFFGAPIAHEDDPQRAVLAGLGIVENVGGLRERLKREHGLDFNVRVGVNTGLVVVGAIGADLKVEYTAMGDAVNVAARMEQTAQPGTVQITEDTYRLIAPLFDVEDLGGIEVKGKSEPVHAYRVLRPAAQVGRLRGIEGLESRLVGREAEMSALRAAVQALGDGRGGIVSVIGEAGLGKSRLVAELRHSLMADGLLYLADGLSADEPAPHSTPHASDHLPRATLWLEGRCLSYEINTPYSPFLSLFTAHLGLQPEQPAGEKYARLKTRVAEAMPERVDAIAPFLASLLGIPLTSDEAQQVKYLEPPQLRARVFQSVVEYIAALATVRPLALVIDDLHWIDPTSLELLVQLLPLTERAVLLIIALFRPQHQEPSWQFHETAARDHVDRYAAIELKPLDAASSRELVANLLHIEDLPEKTRKLILDKAEGNPFFVEEVIRSLLDARLVVRENGHWRATRDIENIAVPDTLAGVITARLDRLDEAAKRAAQTASVIGREFDDVTLADVFDLPNALDAALTDLGKRELVREIARLPHRTFMFKHVLTQETAYASLLLSRRCDLHRRVAESLERWLPDRVNDIARHFLESREAARALPYLVEAGDRAAHAFSMPEASRYYRQALEIAQTSGDAPLARRAYEGLGRLQRLNGDMASAIETFSQMARHAEGQGDTPMRVSALNKLAEAHMWSGQFEAAERHLLEAERLARGCDDRRGLAELYTVRCGICMMTADFAGAIKYLSESVEVGRQLNVKQQMAYGLAHIAYTWTVICEFDRAWEAAQECLRISDEIGHLEYRAEATSYPIPFYYLARGEIDAAKQAAEESLVLATRIGAAMPESDAAYVVGLVAHLRGEYEKALAHYRRSREAGEKAGNPTTAAASSAAGTAWLSIGEALRADAEFAVAAAMLVPPVDSVVGGATWPDMAYVYLLKEDLAAADEFVNKGLTSPTMMSTLQRPRLLIIAAYLALAQGNPDNAAQYVGEARQLIEARPMKYLSPLAAFAAAQVMAARGDDAQAMEEFSRAEMEAAPLGMRPLAWQAQAAAAKLLSAAGRRDEAQMKRRAAQANVDKIAGLLRDEKLRAVFAEHAARKMSDNVAVSQLLAFHA